MNATMTANLLAAAAIILTMLGATVHQAGRLTILETKMDEVQKTLDRIAPPTVAKVGP